jgi:LPXTG-motif cell wall-anchored protein
LEGLHAYRQLIKGTSSVFDLNAPIINNYSDYIINVANSDAIPKDAILKIQTKTEIPSNIVSTLNTLGKTYLLLDFSLLLYGEEIQLESPLTFTMDIPEGYTNPEIYYINDNGSYEKIASTIADEKITFTLTHFSDYALINKEAVQTGDNFAFILILGILLVSGAGVGFLAKKRSI